MGRKSVSSLIWELLRDLKVPWIQYVQYLIINDNQVGHVFM